MSPGHRPLCVRLGAQSALVTSRSHAFLTAAWNLWAAQALHGTVKWRRNFGSCDLILFKPGSDFFYVPLVCLLLRVVTIVFTVMCVHVCMLNSCVVGCMYVWHRSVSLTHSASESPLPTFPCLIPFSTRRTEDEESG